MPDGDLELWHRRLGHSSIPILQNILQSCNIVVNKNSLDYVCDACQKAKAHKLLFPSTNKYTVPF